MSAIICVPDSSSPSIITASDVFSVHEDSYRPVKPDVFQVPGGRGRFKAMEKIIINKIVILVLYGYIRNAQGGDILKKNGIPGKNPALILSIVVSTMPPTLEILFHTTGIPSHGSADPQRPGPISRYFVPVSLNMALILLISPAT